ncbi:MAG: sulfatase [Candidatus Brocadiae bacterium]|nr:sulfatase [Candidatus Brocadiia bacterium]
MGGCAPTNARAAEPKRRLPNIVIVFTDDQGYQDLGCFGSPDIDTPHLDRMAREGRRFTDFYVTQPVCSASRAGLLTGCYSNRVSILGALGPGAKHGIHDDEMTLAELCKQKGYATAMCGKWHLGHRPQFLPTRHGFDQYFGLPYSNDMWPYHPGVRHLPMEKRLKRWPHLPLIENGKIVNPKVTGKEQAQLTTWYAERAVKFIEKSKDRPFFLYVAHSMPHVPLFVSDKFKGKSKRGLYGDVISEIDWSVGQIRATLEKHGLAENTLFIFTSDNGPWLSYGEHSGRALPLREGKGTTWDGGVREPTVMWWPGKIPAGTVCSEPAMTIDILPTLAGLIGAKLPAHKIDGLDIWPLISGQAGATGPHEALFFYWGRHLQAMRSGKWKLHFPHAYRTMAGKPGGKGGIPERYSAGKTALALFDLEKDIGQKTNVADRHPDVVKRLQALADTMRADLGDSATKQKGKGVRPCGRVQG